MTTEPLAASALFHPCDAGQFEFETTAELEELTEIIGQRRALEAVHFGVGMRREGYNLYVMGPSGMGKHTLIERFLGEKAAARPTPPDWVYVNNFDQPHKPRSLRLPAGQGRRLREDMEHFIEELTGSIPAAFEGDEYRTHIQGIEDELKERQEHAFNELSEEAAKHDIKLFRTPSGFAFAPMRDGEVVGPDEFAKWPREAQQHTEEIVANLQEKLQRVIQQIPVWRREVRDRIKALNREVTMSVVGHLIDELKQRYTDLPDVTAYLDAVRQDVVDNVKDFLKGEESENIPGQPQESDPRVLHRYKVNVVVDHSTTEGAPVTYLDNPTYLNLVGRAEHLAQYGALVTDFTLLKPGAFHEASGGYLILDAHKLLTQVYAWEGLKRALYSNEIRIESLEKMLSLVSTVSLEPEPIPLDVKVVILGDRFIYYLLHAYDPDFAELFKVAADFEGHIDRTRESQALYARLIATLAKKEQMRPFDRGAIARVIEHGARLVEDSEKLTTHMRSIADTLREADYWAGEAGRDTVTAEDIQTAIDHYVYRSSRVREQIQEAIQRNTIYIETEGAEVGQINGLSVLAMGQYAFGQPSRITATVHIGEGHVVDIEREVEMGGPIHSKGVLILSSFLASRYAQDHPLSLSASLVFEQSYGGVDGDSASLAELCALISALSGIPIKQSFAMTGSVDQHGKVQPIGGVNEKIEGFFDVCRARGLNGEQGVLIPASNVKHLMLRSDIVEAAGQGQFHVYPVENVDQAISLLTGKAAGERDEEGNYPEDTLNALVQNRLTEMSLVRQTFADQAKDKPKDDEGGIKLDEPS
ncbi:Lon protease family protein [Thiohalomonas denitrificans]|uniref:endopeptidase La n=1 Tax=Thiohalomonas denitrificans TaxID=415747 RepID=A0A1G5PZ79_9GAMM|nr:AAA family ATPase [Thiohalomonas denitrificans]SCZ54688.1 lon-related putative ATP-dependent protease [Thiohalomonas denitrificans]